MKEYPVQIITGNTPSKSNCYRFGNKIMFKTDALKKYEESFIWQCGNYRNLNIDTPFEFYIDVYYQSKRSDLDNSLKVVLDCLQRVKGIKNDNNCCKIVANKFIDKENPRISFYIKTI